MICNKQPNSHVLTKVEANKLCKQVSYHMIVLMTVFKQIMETKAFLLFCPKPPGEQQSPFSYHFAIQNKWTWNHQNNTLKHGFMGSKTLKAALWN